MFRGLLNRVTQLFRGRTRIDEELFEELEESLILSDVGAPTSARLVADLRVAVRRERLATIEEVRDRLQSLITELLGTSAGDPVWSAPPPTVILIVGVNGTGKTTSAAKLAGHYKRQGRRVLLAAADTFRAAAIDQLVVWAERVGVDLIRHQEGTDAAAVVYDAIQAARARGFDMVLVDTAGRLHTRSTLMDELGKVGRIAEKALGRPADEVFIVLDATIGQNAIQQARVFSEVVPLTGCILTKLDGTAKGGAVLSIIAELGIPIRFIGTGEKADDLQPFDPSAFASSLFSEGDA